MSKLDNILAKFFPPYKPIAPGIYTYQSPPEVNPPYRYHLRIEEDGSGVFVVNAKTVLILNQTAAEYAYHMVRGTNANDISSEISHRFKIDPAQALLDYRDFELKIQQMLETPDLDPSIYMTDSRTEPNTTRLSAPLRIDCALTFSVRPEEPAESAPIGDEIQELTTSAWKKILSDAWAFGIPHVIFTGGEATLRNDLAEIIKHAQEQGMVTGLLTDGLRFNDPEYMQSILSAGLDHVMITLQPDNPASWSALDALIAEDIFVTPHLTITKANSVQVQSAFDRIVQMKAPALSLTITDESLALIQKDLRNQAADKQIELIWDIPVPYSALNPVAIELKHEPDEVSGAGRSWLYVEPDGDVYPGQGHVTHLGNVTQVNWETVWENAQTLTRQI